MAASKAEIKKQVEYYLSDSNLSRDKFFNEKISESKDGWLDLTHILACNKVKAMGIAAKDIVEAVKDSAAVEADPFGLKVRRKGGKPVPELAKKRDAKAAVKEEEKKEDDGLPQLDERGNPILANSDFENPIIVHFKVESPTGEFKVNWKDVETAVKKAFPRLKLIYSRADPLEGDLAVSSHRLNNAELAKLAEARLKISGQDFAFSRTAGEELKAFWQKQGGHYQFCIQPKLRNIKKQQKMARQAKEKGGAEGGEKRARTSYEIAGVYYADINKVKSKARAILNLKQDGERLKDNDEQFIKELLAFHEKGADKLKGFSHFEVGEHPDFAKTRCFFVAKADGKKEDFSISKCITRLEQQS